MKIPKTDNSEEFHALSENILNDMTIWEFQGTISKIGTRSCHKTFSFNEVNNYGAFLF